MPGSGLQNNLNFISAKLRFLIFYFVIRVLCVAVVKLFWMISKFVEGQRAGIGKRLGDSRGPEGKSSCWQS
jgi:hypothetical protein